MKPKQQNFVQGLTLSESFYEQIIRPILHEHLPQLKYSGALVGAGSEVLGFDTIMSSDQDWGPQLLYFSQITIDWNTLRICYSNFS